MFKPNEQLREILVACVKPEHLQGLIENLISTVFEYNGKCITIGGEITTTGEDITLFVSPKNFNEVIECGKWYPREKFDGNPCDYIVVEQCGNEDVYYDANVSHALWNSTTHFMYIKKP